MPVISAAVLLLLSVPTPPADKAGEQKLPPHAVIVFAQDPPRAWTTTFELTTASGSCYEVRLHYREAMNHETETTALLLAANWVVELTPFEPVRVYGARTKGGGTDPVRSLVLTHQLVDGRGAMPQVRSVDGVRAAASADGGTAGPARAGIPRPTGPDLGADSFVEFDLATIPATSLEQSPGVTFELYTGAGADGFCCASSRQLDPAAPGEAAAELLESFTLLGCRAEVVGRTRVRLYGHVRQGRYHPALRGSVDSDDLKPGELPRVTNPRS